MHSNSSLPRLLAVNAAIGAAAAVATMGGLLMLDIGGLRHLITDDQTPLVPLAMLALGLIVTFGGAATATAVMALGGDEGGHDYRGGELIPLRVIHRSKRSSTER